MLTKEIPTEILLLSILGGMTVISISLIIAILLYEKNKTSLFSKKEDNDWLFHDFNRKFYDFFYGGRPPKGSMLGINVEQYERQCEIIHKKPETKQVIAMRMEGLVVFLASMILTYFALEVNTAIAIVLAVSGVAGFYVLFFYKAMDVNRKVKIRMERIKEDLPRYVILLEKAMDLPIEQAIVLTAQKFKSPLSDDLIESSNEAALGASGGWQAALINLAKRYDLDSFSGLVLDITNAYNQGNDIKDAIIRKGKDLEEERIYEVEAQDARTKTLVFVPVIIFKLIPLGALIILPMMVSLSNGI